VHGVCDAGRGHAGGAELAVKMSDLIAELTGLVIEFADALVCEGESLPQ
jgi:hypothetical protein